MKREDLEIKLYTLQEVADLVKMDILTIYRHRKEGKIDTIKIGRHYRVTQEQLDKYLKGGE